MGGSRRWAGRCLLRKEGRDFCSLCNVCQISCGITSTLDDASPQRLHDEAARKVVTGSPTRLRSENAELRQQVTVKERLLDAAVDTPLGEPVGARQIENVAHLLRLWLQRIAPRERNERDWRAERALKERLGETEGKAKYNHLKHLIKHVYRPVLFAIMKRHIDDKMALREAVADVEKLRGNYEMYKFVSSDRLPTCTSYGREAGKRYDAHLIDRQLRVEAWMVTTSSGITAPLRELLATVRASPPSEAERAAASAVTTELVSILQPPGVTSSSDSLSMVAAPSAIVPLTEGAKRYLAIDPAT